MIIYTAGQMVTYDNRKWIIQKMLTGEDGHTYVMLKRGCYSTTAAIENIS